MLEAPQRYPLLRGRRRARRRWRALVDPRVLALLLALALLAGGAWWWRRPAPVDARQELAWSLGLLHAGNYSAARAHAVRAVVAVPGWGLAHAVLARAELARGDGAATEGELTRAAATGFDMARGHQILAEARLLQGDPGGAIAEANKAPPRFADAARRITARALAATDDVAGAGRMLAAVVADDPGDAAGWTALGRLRLETGDIGGATIAADRALAANRHDPDALVLTGELVRARFGLVAALPWFDAALARDAFHVPALLAKAATLGDLGRYGDMLAATRAALAARPGEPQAYYYQAVLAARAGKRDLARALLARTNGAIDTVPAVLLLQGALDYGDARWEQAIGRWRTLVGLQPTNIAARRLLAAALLRSGDAQGTLDLLQPLAVRGDADSYTVMLVARAFEASGRRDWAARYLDRAAAIAATGPAASSAAFASTDTVAALALAAAQQPDDPQAAVELIRAQLAARDAPGALARAQALVRGGPGAPAAWLALGDCWAALGKMTPAADAYVRAADLRFDEPAMLRLVDAYGRVGRRDRAVRALALYWGQNPASSAALRLAAAMQLSGGEWAAAGVSLARLRRLEGGRDVTLWLGIAAARAGAGDWPRARDAAASAYALAPMNVAATDGYGRALLESGNTAAAVPVLTKAVALAPRVGVVRWHLAQALAAMGREGEARGQAQVALADRAFAEREAAQALLAAMPLRR